MLFSIAVSACGGGGGGSGGGASQRSTGSISGTSIPGAIIGANCYDENGAPCSIPAYTTVADANGKYSFPSITQRGRYAIYASHGGYSSSGGNSCSFYYDLTFFDCTWDVPLTSTFLTPPTTGVSFPYSVNGMSGIANLSCTNGNWFGTCVAGARTITSGSVYEWDDAFGHTMLYYDSTHDAIGVTLIPSSNPSGDGVICGVSSSININGLWYYPCSSIGITFDRAVGVITFSTTPIYHSVGQYGLAYPYAPGIYNPVASGSLTFPPF